MAGAKLLAYCDDCGYGWIPQKSKGQLQCAKCGSRNVLRATFNAILDHVRKKVTKERPERVRGGVCPVCGAKPGCVCIWCGAGFNSYRARVKHIREEHPERARQPGGQRKEGAQDLSLWPETGRVDGRAGKGPHERPHGKPTECKKPRHKDLGVSEETYVQLLKDWEEHRAPRDDLSLSADAYWIEGRSKVLQRERGKRGSVGYFAALRLAEELRRAT